MPAVYMLTTLQKSFWGYYKPRNMSNNLTCAYKAQTRILVSKGNRKHAAKRSSAMTLLRQVPLIRSAARHLHLHLVLHRHRHRHHLDGFQCEGEPH